MFNHSNSDTRGVDNFPANPWNLKEDYGRAAFDIHHRATIGGTANLPFAVRVSSMLMAASGQPFSILLSQDIYGTGDAQRAARARYSVNPGSGCRSHSVWLVQSGDRVDMTLRLPPTPARVRST